MSLSDHLKQGICSGLCKRSWFDNLVGELALCVCQYESQGVSYSL
jgi:hypothetical protein